jgi:hypothetical protein
MQDVVKAVVASLTKDLGHELEAIYLFGSVLDGSYQADTSDINLWLVTADSHDIHTIRSAFRPLWQKHGDVLRHTPWVSPHTAFLRHIELNPLLALHLAQSGRRVFGRMPLLDSVPPTSKHELYAHLASEFMQASLALAPNMLETDKADERLQQLQRLARRLLGKEKVKGKTAVSLFAHLQGLWQHKTADLPTDQPWTNEVPPDTSFPGLQAIYREAGDIVMVFAELTPATIQDVDWAGLGEELKSDYSGLRVTTAEQLRLMIEYDTPLDLKLRRYTHEWGLDPLAELQVESWRVLRTAARIPSQIRTVPFPHHYFTRGDDQAGKVIHDFQNRMLNIQLEHELMCRLEKIERFVPPQPLPAPDSPSKQRIDSIFQHLDWWSEYYTQQMHQAQ